MRQLFALTLTAAAALSAVPFASGQESRALVEALVRKGVLTPAEAAEIQAEVAEEKQGSPEGKLKLSDSISELAISGSLRFRYQHDALSPQLPDKAAQQQSRFRFGLRLNADFKLGDDWFGGLQVTVTDRADSGFTTYGDGFGNHAIYLSRAFIGWEATDWATFVLGKQPNPLMTTALLWDPDISPEGLTEEIALHKLLDWGEDSPWELDYVGGQFVFSHDHLLNPHGAYLFANQLRLTRRFSGDRSLTIAPAHLIYTHSSVREAHNAKPFDRVSTSPWVTAETANLSLLQLPGEYRFKAWDLPMTFLWDGVYNFKGSERVRETYGLSSHATVDDFAFLVGLKLGENRRAGDWSLYGDFRQVGIGAIDPNLNDSDWSLSRLNLRGFKGTLAYNFTDFAVGQVSYMTGWNVRKNLTGGQATGGAALGDANTVDVLQVEMNVQF